MMRSLDSGCFGRHAGTGLLFTSGCVQGTELDRKFRFYFLLCSMFEERGEGEELMLSLRKELLISRRVVTQVTRNLMWLLLTGRKVDTIRSQHIIDLTPIYDF